MRHYAFMLCAILAVANYGHNVSQCLLAKWIVQHGLQRMKEIIYLLGAIALVLG